MKLAFVLFSYFPEGGLQQDFLKITKACLNKGANISVFTMSWQGPECKDINLNILPSSGLGATTKRKHFVKRFLQEIKQESFDAVVGFNRMPGLDYYYGADSCYASKAFGERSFLYRLTSRCRQYLKWEREVFGDESKTSIFLISPLQKQQYLEFYLRAESRMIDLPPGIKSDRMAGNDAEILRHKVRAEFGFEKNTIVILQIGTYFKVKGVKRSLLAIASLNDELKQRVRYLLVGKDDPSAYQSFAQSLGIQQNLIVVPQASSIPGYLQAADLMLHPSHSESAGMVLLEAIVAGLPVLTTDTCGYAFYVEKARAGKVCQSPFRQEALNTLLAETLDELPSSAWSSNGILFGQQEDLYHMPERVAETIMAESAE